MLAGLLSSRSFAIFLFLFYQASLRVAIAVNTACEGFKLVVL